MMSREVLDAGWALAAVAPPPVAPPPVVAPLLVALSGSGQTGNVLVQLIPFGLVLAIFYFIIFLPMKRRQQKVQEFLSALKVGDRIVTSGGLYGSITKVNEQTVQVQVAQNVRLEVARSAIVGYQGQAPVVDGPNA